jgi:GAF domain-containing protein
VQRLETQPAGERAGARPPAAASDGAPASLREISGMLAVSRAVAAGGPLPALLDHIAAEAATVVGARSASILLLEGRDHFRLAGAHGLSAGYAALLAGAPTQLAPGHGPSGLAVAEGRAIAIEDTETDARFAPWRAVARREGYRALASVPLRSHADTLGALNVYRSRAEPWRRRQLLLLSFFGEHAASAIRTAQLIDRQTRQVAALTRVARGQREQMHEHANRLHAIPGLLALDAHEDAERFVTTLEQAHHSAYGSVAERLHQQVVAGLVLAEIAAAQRRGITLVSRIPRDRGRGGDHPAGRRPGPPREGLPLRELTTPRGRFLGRAAPRP